MSNAERLEELIEQAELAHNLPVLRVQPTKTLLKAIDSEILQPLEQRIAELETQVRTKQAWIADASGMLQTFRDYLKADPPWMPIAPNKIYVDGLVTINFFDDRMTVQHAENAPIMIYLEPDIRMCRKVQAAQVAPAQKGETEP